MKPTAQEILRAREPNTTQEITISECAHGLWIVVYQGRPIQIRRQDLYRDIKKYLPGSWTQQGGAQSQAQHLNQLFNTTDFEIVCIRGKTHQ